MKDEILFESINELKPCIDLVLDSIQDLEFTGTKNILSARLLNIALSHCQSIQLLCQKKLPASAYALLRPLVETSYRGFWIHWCADDKELEKLKKENFKWKGPYHLAQEINESTQAKDLLGTIWEKHGNEMHGLTHGGMEAASLSYGKNGEIQISITGLQAHQLMQITAHILFTIFYAFIKTGNSKDLDSKLSELGDRIKKWHGKHLKQSQPKQRSNSRPK